MNGRLPDNRELSVEDIEAIGYTWRVLSPVMRIPKAGDRVLVNGFSGKISDKGVQIFTGPPSPYICRFVIGEAFVEVDFENNAAYPGVFRLNEINLRGHQNKIRQSTI